MDHFETIVGAEDYSNSKPAPDAYLLAAERLGVAPKDCLVLKTRIWASMRQPLREWLP
jgi:HAD superfamily hydrolase (TIGR01509 family)